MAVAQFRHPVKGISKSVGMFAPSKKIQQLSSWLKEARKKIADIPKDDDKYWTLTESIASTSYIRFTFEARDGNGDRCYVVIDRTKHAFSNQ